MGAVERRPPGKEVRLAMRACRRREFLRRTTAGLAVGGLGLYRALARAAEVNGGHLLAPRPAHFEPKARQLVVVFLSGGFSHVDTFDYKPQLKAHEGKSVSAVSLRETAVQPLMGSPFKFTPR